MRCTVTRKSIQQFDTRLHRVAVGSHSTMTPNNKDEVRLLCEIILKKKLSLFSPQLLSRNRSCSQ